MSTIDIAWLAGLLEGEGTFGRYKNNIVISMQTTDKDIARKAAKLLDTPLRFCNYNNKKNPKWSGAWVVTLHGNRAASWMMTLYALMGQRRRGKIKEVLTAWRSATCARRTPRKTAHFQEACS